MNLIVALNRRSRGDAATLLELLAGAARTNTVTARLLALHDGRILAIGLFEEIPAAILRVASKQRPLPMRIAFAFAGKMRDELDVAGFIAFEAPVPSTGSRIEAIASCATNA